MQRQKTGILEEWKNKGMEYWKNRAMPAYSGRIQTIAEQQNKVSGYGFRAGVELRVEESLIKEERRRISGGSEFLGFLCYVTKMIRFKQIPGDIHQRIASLPDFFGVDPDIIFAYLFGGLLRDRPNPLRDVDVAIYVRNPKKLDYLKLFSRIAKILGTDEIDLVILNKASLALTGRILQNRKVLIDKNPFLRHKYESLILREFFDFQIKERDILKRRYGIG